MFGLRFGALALWLVSSLVLAVLLTGCGGGGVERIVQDEDDDSGAGAGPKATKVALEKGTGVLKGRVTFAGGKPDLQALTNSLVNTMAGKDKPNCVDKSKPQDKEQQDWRISDDGGVADVIIFIKPANRKTFFACAATDPGVTAVKDKVEQLEQPFCMFHPHAKVLFPSYFEKDANGQPKEKKTGQKFEIINNAQINHNASVKDAGGNSPDVNQAIVPGDKLPLNLKPSNGPVTISCSIHTWMSANVWVLNSPYYAMTDKDGNYEIKNVPTGSVNIVAWHGKAGFINTDEASGEPVELSATTTKKDFSVKPK
jgi:hypothetical protein